MLDVYEVDAKLNDPVREVEVDAKLNDGKLNDPVIEVYSAPIVEILNNRYIYFQYFNLKGELQSQNKLVLNLRSYVY